MKISAVACFLLVLVVCGAVSRSYGEEDLGDVGTFPKWQMIEISMEGPQSRADGTPNPFAIVVDVTFTGPSGTEWTIPAFYNGDGAGGQNGSVWQVRFSGPEVGDWAFVSSSTNEKLNNVKGSFTVSEIPGDAQGFYKTGRIQYTGTAENKIRYFKFADGPYWIKCGADSPEGFLSITNDWYYNSLEKRKEGIDYLSDVGINSLYMMVGMIGGDYPSKVWPWLEPVEENSGSDDNNNFDDDAVRFHIPRLEDWLDLFHYMQKKGVAVYMIGQDDDSDDDYNHGRFYRELIARFGWLPGVMFNDKEESGVKAEAIRFSEMDPYGIPTACHNYNYPSQERSHGIVENAHFDMTSIQSGRTHHPFDEPGSCSFDAKKAPAGLCHNMVAIAWINACKSQNKRVLVVNFDEPRGGAWSSGRHMWWSAYIGGAGGFEYLETSIGKEGETFADYDDIWTTLAGAGRFMEHFEFVAMEPRNDLITDGRAFCLAEPGKQYAVYVVDDDEPDFTIKLQSGTKYELSWWNPENGPDGVFEGTQEIDGGTQTLTLPSRAGKLGDWAVRIVAKGGGTGNVAPSASDGNVSVNPGESVAVTLSYTDNDGPGPYTFSIRSTPEQGTLESEGGSVTYTASEDAPVNTTDSFAWSVHDGEDESNVATVSVYINNPDNDPPVASGDSVVVTSGESVTVPLLFDDPDSDGPFTLTITRAPSLGTFEPTSEGGNEYTYTPEGSFEGTDTASYTVSDELGAVSDEALVLFVVEPLSTGQNGRKNGNVTSVPIMRATSADGALMIRLNVPAGMSQSFGKLQVYDLCGKLLHEKTPSGPSENGATSVRLSNVAPTASGMLIVRWTRNGRNVAEEILVRNF